MICINAKYICFNKKKKFANMGEIIVRTSNLFILSFLPHQDFVYFSVAHPLQFLCTNLKPITSPRLRGHLAAVDKREQLLTGLCRGGVSQAPRPKRLWRLIHCSGGLHSPHPACYCHRDRSICTGLERNGPSDAHSERGMRENE